MKLLATAYVGLFILVAAAILAVWYARQRAAPTPPVSVALAPPQPAAAAETPPDAPVITTEQPEPEAPAADPAAPAPAADTEEPAAAPEVALAPVEQALLEDGQDGPLPRIGPDGREPWQAYTRPFTAPASRPRIAVVVAGLGLGSALTDRAIDELPGEVTLAFSPYAHDLFALGERARRAGHETLAAVTMESGDPNSDPGPHALRSAAAPAENAADLKWFLSRLTGYVGLLTVHGQRFTAEAASLRPVLQEAEARGLMFVDGGTTDDTVTPRLAQGIDLPLAVADIRIGADLARAAIDAQLLEAEVVARLKGAAVVVVRPHAVVLDRLARWIPEAKRNGMAIAPITAVANRQKLR